MVTKPVSEPAQTPAAQPPSTQVYAVHGADPEVLAYGMAKYSRSALSLRESLAELNEQKAEKFLNTFYFQYGHRSIADLAHIAFAIERLSILAATILGRRAALGWPGTFHTLPGLPAKRLLCSRVRRRCRGRRALPSHGRPPVRRISALLRRDVRLFARAHTQARRDEAGRV